MDIDLSTLTPQELRRRRAYCSLPQTLKDRYDWIRDQWRRGRSGDLVAVYDMGRVLAEFDANEPVASAMGAWMHLAVPLNAPVDKLCRLRDIVKHMTRDEVACLSRRTLANGSTITLDHLLALDELRSGEWRGVWIEKMIAGSLTARQVKGRIRASGDFWRSESAIEEAQRNAPRPRGRAPRTGYWFGSSISAGVPR